MNNSTQQELWVLTLRAYRDLCPYQAPVIRSGTTPILDLMILEQLDPCQELWYVYGCGHYDDGFWRGMRALPQYQDRMWVARAQALMPGLTGIDHWELVDDDAWVMSIQPRLASTSRTL
jgi:hypothetical protein